MCRIELKFDDEEDVFPAVLRFMYSGEIVLTESNSLAILAMADKVSCASCSSLSPPLITPPFLSGCALLRHTSLRGITSVQYLIHSLRDLCVSYINQSIKPSNALVILERAFQSGVRNIADV